MLRRFTDYILQGRPQAMGVAFVCAFVPIIGSISILIAAFITLRKGIFEGALVTCAATIPYLLGYIGETSASHASLAVVALTIVVASNLLTWFFALLLGKYGNWNVVLEVAALLGICFVVIVHISYPEIQNWWAAQITSYFNKSTSFFGILSTESDVPTKEAQAMIVGQVKQYATGLFAASVLFNVLLQLMIARWWQGVIYNPGGLRKELYQVRLSFILALTFVIGLVMAYRGNGLSLDALPVLYAVFCLAGLSLMHRLFTSVKMGWLGLLLVYVGLVVRFFPVSAFIVVIGLLDSLANIRDKVRRLDS